jgi:hypothetical protein
VEPKGRGVARNRQVAVEAGEEPSGPFPASLAARRRRVRPPGSSPGPTLDRALDRPAPTARLQLEPPVQLLRLGIIPCSLVYSGQTTLRLLQVETERMEVL